MRIDPRASAGMLTDDWLESHCRHVESAGRELAQVVSEINQRTEQAAAGELGKRRRITESQIRSVQEACRILHEVQVAVQDAVFDCEHELRDLRERDMDPAELLIDGERLIRHYRFLRRRARVIDGLLAYLPTVTSLSNACLEHLRRLQNGSELRGPLIVPDCGFALAALDQLRDENGRA